MNMKALAMITRIQQHKINNNNNIHEQNNDYNHGHYYDDHYPHLHFNTVIVITMIIVILRAITIRGYYQSVSILSFGNKQKEF